VPSHFPNSPKLVKGALIEFGDALLGLLPNVIVFQYNPEQLTRKLDQRAQQAPAGADRERRETFRTAKLPVESISDLKLVLDATDQLEQADPVAAARGIGPAIAALEMMMFPSGTSLINLGSLLGIAGQSSASVPPQQLPLVMFVWGPWRVIPVNVTTVSVQEQEFDPLLNPIKAEVTVSLRVISKDDLDRTSFAYGAYVWTQGNREVNALLNIKNTLQLAGGMLPF
jgi:hypothetical protein